MSRYATIGRRHFTVERVRWRGLRWNRWLFIAPGWTLALGWWVIDYYSQWAPTSPEKG